MTAAVGTLVVELCTVGHDGIVVVAAAVAAVDADYGAGCLRGCY